MAKERSKFFGSSSSGSDSSSDSESEVEVQQKFSTVKVQQKRKVISDSDSDSDAGPKRVVKSSKDKRFDALRQTVSKLNNAKKVSDFSVLQEQYDDLFKQRETFSRFNVEVPAVFYRAIGDLEDWLAGQQDKKKDMKKAKAVQLNKLVSKCRRQNLELREEIDAARAREGEEEEDAGGRLDGGGSSSEDSDSSDSDSDAGAGSDSDDDGTPAKPKRRDTSGTTSSGGSSSDSDDDDTTGRAAAAGKSTKKGSASSSSSSSDSDSDSDSSSSSSDSDFEADSDSDSDVGFDENAAREERRKRWLMTEKDYAKLEKEKAQKQEEEKARKEREQLKLEKSRKKQMERDLLKDGGEDGALLSAESKQLEEQKLKLWRESFDGKSVQAVIEKTLEFLKPGSRMDRREKLRKAQVLIECCAKLELWNFELGLKVEVCGVNLSFVDGKTAYGLVKTEKFRLCVESVKKDVLGGVLTEKLLGGNFEAEVEKVEKIMADYNCGKGIDREAILAPFEISAQLQSVLNLIEAVDTECYQGLQHPDDLAERIENLVRTLDLLIAAIAFFERLPSQKKSVALLKYRLLQNVYSLEHKDVRNILRNMLSLCGSPSEKNAHQHDAADITGNSSTSLLEKDEKEVFARYCLPHSDEEVRVWIHGLCDDVIQGIEKEFDDGCKHLQATLCKLYSMFLNNQYTEARNLMHYLDLQAQVEQGSTAAIGSLELNFKLYVLWNRVLAQMGLAAFREGKVYETHIALLDFNSFMKAKELLSQGVTFQRGSERDKDKEENQERNVLPYHMQIPLDLLESVALLCGMLLEVPNMAFLAYDKIGRKRFQTIYSKPLRNMLEKGDRSTVLTPPESNKDKIIDAARKLMAGEWKKCFEHIESLQVLKTHGEKIDRVNALGFLQKNVKKEAVKIYLWNYASSYETISLGSLAEMFELELSDVRSLLHRMLYDRKLAPQIALDATGNHLVNRRDKEPTSLQQKLVSLATTLDFNLDYAERGLDMKLGRGFTKEGRGKEHSGNKLGLHFSKQNDGLQKVDRYGGGSSSSRDHGGYNQGGNWGDGGGEHNQDHRGLGSGKGFGGGKGYGGKGKGKGKGFGKNKGAGKSAGPVTGTGSSIVMGLNRGGSGGKGREGGKGWGKGAGKAAGFGWGA